MGIVAALFRKIMEAAKTHQTKRGGNLYFRSVNTGMVPLVCRRCGKPKN